MGNVRPEPDTEQTTWSAPVSAARSGERGIRTHGEVAPTAVYRTAASAAVLVRGGTAELRGLAAGSMTAGSSGRDTPQEHLRFAAWLQALHQVPDDDELTLVAEVLQDPDVAMAQGAVLRHLDQRASTLIHGPDYAPWTQAMAGAVASRPFLLQCLHEWSLFRAITLGQPWSHWLQLKIAGSPGTREDAAVLAQAGRTKRIRNTARAAVTAATRRAGIDDKTTPGTHVGPT